MADNKVQEITKTVKDVANVVTLVVAMNAAQHSADIEKNYQDYKKVEQKQSAIDYDRRSKAEAANAQPKPTKGK